MFEMIFDFFFTKNKKAKGCYTYIGKNREYKRNVLSRTDRATLKDNKVKKPSALSKYFEDAKSLLNNDVRSIV